MSHDWYQPAPQPERVDTYESTLAACPRCGEPVYEPGVWVVKGADFCGNDCAANAGGHL